MLMTAKVYIVTDTDTVAAYPMKLHTSSVIGFVHVTADTKPRRASAPITKSAMATETMRQPRGLRNDGDRTMARMSRKLVMKMSRVVMAMMVNSVVICRELLESSAVRFAEPSQDVGGREECDRTSLVELVTAEYGEEKTT